MSSQKDNPKYYNYLTGEDILVIHSDIIDETGGTHGVRDTSLLSSIIERPKTSLIGHEPYPAVYDKAAVYLQSFAEYQIFVDGNKRTAIASAVRFLETNGYVFQSEIEDALKTMLLIASKKLTLTEIAAWLKKNSKAAL